ncbi:MAG: TolB family protein [Thermoleophilia bacterium]
MAVAALVLLAFAASAQAAVFPARPDAAGAPLTRDAIVFDTSAGGIHVVNADGTGYRNIVPGIGPRRPQWSPDGGRIVYELTRDPQGYARPSNKIIIANPDGSGRRVIARGFSPAWSADGREIYIHRNIDYQPNGLPLFAVEVATRKVRALGFAGTTSRSADGTMMVKGGGEIPVHPYADNLYTILRASDGSVVKVVGVRRRPFGYGPSWSRTGYFLYACGGLRGRGASDICTFNPRTGDQGALPGPAGVAEYEAVFAPRGTRFAASGTDGLYVMDLRSKRVTWLWRNPAAGERNSHAVFSPHWRPAGG